MSAQAVHDTISARLATAGYPVQWMGGTLADMTAPEFLRLMVTAVSRQNLFLTDNSAARIRGMIMVDCFASLGAGMSRVHQIADEVAELFQREDRLTAGDALVYFPHGAFVRSPMAAGARAQVTVQAGYEVYQ